MSAQAMPSPGRFSGPFPGGTPFHEAARWMRMAMRGEHHGHGSEHGRGHGRGRGRDRGGFGFPPFGGFPFGGPGGGPGGPWGRRPRVRRGDVRAAALALLAEKPMNGYQIIQEIRQRSEGMWRPSSGSVYPALQQLEDEGLIRAVEQEGGRRAFELTEAGRSHVEERAEELRAPWAAVTEDIDNASREFRHLVQQTAFAVMQVMQAGSPAQVEEARKVLNETRKAMYRILAEDDLTSEDDEPEG
ncbi:PadR family transcriptional regulator [Streptoalloteichus hindustanus]|uniref:Transcriptional regulator, PadR family n=1 Tax=Streptoalloteichus hindustanus TaxID=2017 RepID=A0A1M4UJY6_STRHI|nr:PadR family transcriptional regulator [Streptoalloteichus hindustanus]SHE57091.1 transcriptional regulator, PadR family [Streptoalloteichus hindustanus]